MELLAHPLRLPKVSCKKVVTGQGYFTLLLLQTPTITVDSSEWWVSCPGPSFTWPRSGSSLSGLPRAEGMTLQVLSFTSLQYRYCSLYVPYRSASQRRMMHTSHPSHNNRTLEASGIGIGYCLFNCHRIQLLRAFHHFGGVNSSGKKPTPTYFPSPVTERKSSPARPV